MRHAMPPLAALTLAMPLLMPLAAPASADEVIIRRDAPVEVVPVRPPPAVVVEPRRDCATTTTRRENGLGDSETVTRRECD